MKYLVTIMAMLFATSLSAATFTVDSIAGNWSDVTGTTATGEGTDTISWGGGTAQSSYNFAAAGTPLVDPVNPFQIGTFTHNNIAIIPPSITGATLNLTVTGNVDGVGFSIGGAYAFSHLETPNSANPCAAGGVAPCPDLVTYLGATSFTDSIIVGDQEFFLSIEGFADGFTFLTAEGQSNSAALFAGFTTAPVVVNAVPLPAGAWLMLGGMGALYGMRRRKGKRA